MISYGDRAWHSPNKVFDEAIDREERGVAEVRLQARQGQGQRQRQRQLGRGVVRPGRAHGAALRGALCAGARGRGLRARRPLTARSACQPARACRRPPPDDGRRTPAAAAIDRGITRLRALHVQHQKREIHHEEEPRTEQIHANGHRIARRIVGKARVQ